jgi:hypothetical protein
MRLKELGKIILGAGSADVGTVSIDDALRDFTILAWDDFAAYKSSRAVRIEYLCEPGIRLYELTIWVITAGGYQERFCDYRLAQSAERPEEWRCWTKAHCTQLVDALNLVMQTQKRFHFTPDAPSHGIVIVPSPSAQERSEARVWIEEIGAAESEPPVRARAA